MPRSKTKTLFLAYALSRIMAIFIVIPLVHEFWTRKTAHVVSCFIDHFD